MQSKLNYTVLLTTVLIIVGLLTALMLFKSESETISSMGTAQLTVQPDEAVVYLLVETKGKTAEDAKNENSRITDKIMKELAQMNLKTVETENYNIRQDYDWDNGKRIDRGFVATNTIKAKAKDFDDVGPLVDKSVDAGAIINSINFELSMEKQNEYKALVLAEASKDARNKAEATVSGLGKKIGKVKSVSTSDYNYQPYPIFARAEMAADMTVEKAVATVVNPKNLDITATVSVVFEIK